MDDELKLDNLKNKPSEKIGEFKRYGLIRNVDQLSDQKKRKNGFNIGDSVIDVEQTGYAISEGDDILFTYGIDTCCGLVIFDENKRVLFHLDSSINIDDIKSIILEFGMKDNANVVVAPGARCKKESGGIDYKSLEESLTNIGYNVQECKIPVMFGFITVTQDGITIGSALDRSLDKRVNISYPKKLTRESMRIVEEALNDTNIAKLGDIKNIINKNIIISREEGERDYE